MTSRATLFLAVAAVLSVPLATRAHCDTLDGPVASSARKALESRAVSLALAWVKPSGEKEVRAAFRRALQARDRGAASSAAAERRFLETLVRVHRAGEGAPYTGLKPAGAEVPAAVRAADHALETGDVAEVERPLVAAVTSGLHRRFEALRALPPPGEDVAAGRAWVAAYVDYVHHVERLDATARAEGGHGEAHADGHVDGHQEAPGAAARQEAAPSSGAREAAAPAAPPPATVAILQAAYESDVNAQARFAAHAEQADREGYGQVAALFRAAAHAEGVHARTHGAVLRRLGSEARASPATPKVGTTRANLLQALGNENAERASGYPRAVEQARRDALPEAVLTFTLAHGAEVGLVQLYQEALANLDRMRAPGDALYVCETCGHVVRGAPPVRCPVSLSGGAAFTRVG